MKNQFGGRILGVIWLALLGLVALSPLAAEEAKAKWTVMIYMNGDNDLEKFAVGDFLEMAEVGSTSDVNIIVQFDRRTEKEYKFGALRVAPGWTKTLRFRVEKGMKPLMAYALNRGSALELDMGHPDVLSDFVEWAQEAYEADRYALVIWDHGDGFRGIPPEVPGGQPRQERFYRSSEEGAHRAVSHDLTDSDFLYNFELQTALRRALNKKNGEISVLGFDACLMGMVEVSFAMRDFAQVMVASEDLVPGTGWEYADWLRPLVENPEAFGPEELAQLLVSSYQTAYQVRDPATTQSAVRLTQAEMLADAVSALSEHLLLHLDEELGTIRAAREACSIYAPATDCQGRPCYQNVDLGRFCSELARLSGNPSIVQAAEAVVSRLRSMVLATYAGPGRVGNFGSTGLAIYFPPDLATYQNDGIRTIGYKKDNTDNPVEFVQKHKWADFLHAYFVKVN